MSERTTADLFLRRTPLARGDGAGPQMTLAGARARAAMDADGRSAEKALKEGEADAGGGGVRKEMRPGSSGGKRDLMILCGGAVRYVGNF